MRGHERLKHLRTSERLSHVADTVPWPVATLPLIQWPDISSEIFPSFERASGERKTVSGSLTAAVKMVDPQRCLFSSGEAE